MEKEHIDRAADFKRQYEEKLEKLYYEFSNSHFLLDADQTALEGFFELFDDFVAERFVTIVWPQFEIPGEIGSTKAFTVAAELSHVRRETLKRIEHAGIDDWWDTFHKENWEKYRWRFLKWKLTKAGGMDRTATVEGELQNYGEEALAMMRAAGDTVSSGEMWEWTGSGGLEKPLIPEWDVPLTMEERIACLNLNEALRFRIAPALAKAHAQIKKLY